MGFYDYSYQSIEGTEVSLSQYRDKVVVVVNTASKCGFTPQYEGLQQLYDTYRDKGLVVIGFPCNQFMEQEPGNNEEVSAFCKLRYGVTFPLSAKIAVRGDEMHPLFAYLTQNTAFNGFGKGLKNKGLETMLRAKYGRSFSDSSVKWNFTKFLIDRDGSIVGRYEPTQTPGEMETAIKECLDKK